ncbi:hypothetical protein [Pseudoduganella sp. OTU4001]|uniref:hypothetical protein n=1 Tax=Pseudoduganella sp. OTU4001 TaxID=3043854 RepID=UPI00313C6BF7
MNKLARYLPVLGALFLAACGGGGGGSATQALATGGQGIAVGEPAPGAPAKDDFIKMARGDVSCSDRTNRLYIIDGKQVFWEVAGNCADASYRNTLFGMTPQALQCTNGDSIAGPRTTCTDASQRALFDIIVANLDKPDLGLGAGHKVEYVPFLPKDGPLAFQKLATEQISGLTNAENVVARDEDAFRKLWTGVYQNRVPAPDLPKIDFTRKMVLAVATGYGGGCTHVGIEKVSVSGDALLVNYHVIQPADGMACAAVVTSPVSMVLVDRIDAKVNFSGI